MIIHIDFHGGVPIYKQVMDQVRRLIMTGQVTEGEQLESVKNLSARLKVNPMTISKAYSFLAQEGLVERRRGVGLFVTSINSATTKRLKASMLAEALRAAATMAVQLGIEEQEALRLFGKHFAEMHAKKRGISK